MRNTTWRRLIALGAVGGLAGCAAPTVVTPAAYAEGARAEAATTKERRVQPTEVAVLATLHGLHREVPGYDFDALERAILALEPDVLCMELDSGDLQKRDGFGSKVEYPEVVLPLLDAKGWDACTLEPSGKVADEIIQRLRSANAAFNEGKPDLAKSFGEYVTLNYTLLKTHWASPAEVNDAITDAVFAGKHAIQSQLMGEGEREGWEAWNEHFLEEIEQAVSSHRGQRVVALVGAEHGYWLRARLREVPAVTLVDTAAALH
ncbi:MAG: hypothetical protein AAGN82_22590 [Myxococcota bacterium]